MQDGRWITRPCDWTRVEALAGELGVSETTATVLVRRGLDDPVEARAFLEADDPRHDPLSLGDMAAAVERIRAAVAAGQRICVHGDYDVDGISATAVCVLVLRELGATVDWRLPSRFDEGYGLALETIEQLAADGVDLVVTVDCGITAVAEVARARELGVDVIVTDHHRPGRGAARLPRRRDPSVRLPVRRPLRDGRRPHPRAGAARRRSSQARADARPRRARDHRRRRPARRREPRARRPRAADARAHEPSRPPGADALGARRPGSRRRDGRRLPARAADQRRRPARAAQRGARAPAHRGRGRGREARRRARGAEPRAAGRRGADPPRGGRAGRVVVARRAAAARLRPLGRDVARGRERDRRLAARRAVQPARRADRPERHGLEGIGPLDLDVRPARGARRLRRPSRALRRAPRRRRAVDRDGAARGVPRGVRGARRRRPDRRRPSPGDHDRRDRAGPRADARACGGARPARAVRARQPRADAARRERGGRLREHGGGGEAPPLPHPPARARRRVGDRLRARQRARPAPAARPLRRRVPPEGEPLERDGRPAARRPPCVRRGDGVRRAPGVARGQWRAGEDAWTPDARAIFAELGLVGGNGAARAPGVGDLPGAARAPTRSRCPKRRSAVVQASPS